MQIDISGHHVGMTEALKNHVIEKVSKIEHHFDTVTDVHCILTVDGDRHVAEATMNVKGKRLYAESTKDNMYTAIDSMAHKLTRRVRRHKERLHDHHTKEANKIAISKN